MEKLQEGEVFKWYNHEANMHLSRCLFFLFFAMIFLMLFSAIFLFLLFP